MRGESGRVAARVRVLLEQHAQRPPGAADPAGESGAATAFGAGAVLPGRPDDDEVVEDDDWFDPVQDPRPSAASRWRDPVPVGSGPGGVGAATTPAGGAPTPHVPRAPSGAAGRLVARLAARAPVRIDPGRRAALAVGAAVLVAAVVTGLWLVAHRPRALAVSSSPAPIAGASAPVGSAPAGAPGRSAAGGAAGAGPPPSASASPALVVVDVAGRVRRPGLYRLPAGARIDDAVTAAGGPLRGVDLSGLNLAARLVDGQQVLVGVPGAAAATAPGPAAGSAAAGGSGAAPSGPVNLNTATLEQLETLPGVGPVLGQHILDWRTEHGSFASVEQLDDVTGIGTVKFGQLKALVTV